MSQCNCEYPVSIRVGDIVISRRVKKNGMVAVYRYCDCLFCGPHVVRMDVLPLFDDYGRMIRKDFVEPIAAPAGEKGAGE